MSSIDTTTWLCGVEPHSGQAQRFPRYFEKRLRETYLREPRDVLVMFSGSCAFGTTTDIRPETGADIIAPYDALPTNLGPFDLVLADPPYNAGYGAVWQADLPRPKRIAAAAVKVLRDGGLFLLLHIIVLPAYKDLGLERIALHPVLCGPNHAIRVLNVMRVHKPPSSFYLPR
jgi:hypothetical protein